MDKLTEIVPLAKKLIAFSSVSGDIPQANEILKIVKKELTGFQHTSFISSGLPSLLFSNQNKDTKKFKIILNAHLDVVPAEEEQFVPIEKEGRLYGRGAFDMKAAAAVMILLFKEMADKVDFPLGLQITMDEEISGFNGTRYQVQQGIRADFAIMGECNSNFKVTNQSKGRFEGKIIIEGDSAHAAHPWRGENAVWKMYQALEPLMKAFPIPETETFTTTVSITKIESENNATNQIPGHCVAYLDIRYQPEDADNILTKIRALLPKNAVFEAEDMRKPHSVDPENKYIKLLRKITTETLKQELPLRSAHATSDAPFFSEVGCPAVEFGPIGNSPHHENEWVDIKSLGQYYEILQKFLLSSGKL